MDLKNKMNLDYNEALKAKDKSKISTYRLILSAIKDLDISNRSGPNKKDTDDDDIKKLLKKMIKQRVESIDVYKKNENQIALELSTQINDLIKNDEKLKYKKIKSLEKVKEFTWKKKALVVYNI